MATYKSKSLFSEVFYVIIDNFNIAHANLVSNNGKIDVSTDDVANWVRGSAPRREKFKALTSNLNVFLSKRSLESLCSKSDFIGSMDAIFVKYGLIKNWDNIKENIIEYQELILSALELSYDYKNIKTNTSIIDCSSKQKKPPKVVVFDLDGTLIKGIKYSWRLLYQAAGLSTDQCKANKKKFELGELSYPDWVRYDCDALKNAGLTKEMAQNATKSKCSLTKNFYEAIRKLKDAGCVVGVISGGADVVLYTLIPEADEIFDRNIYINRIVFDDQSGEIIDIVATPYDWDDDGKVRGVSGKNEGLKRICAKYNVDLKDSVFVGDDDNDFKAMRLAGTKILYHSCSPDDETLGTGSRKLPGDLVLIIKNDLMEVANFILKEIK